MHLANVFQPPAVRQIRQQLKMPINAQSAPEISWQLYADRVTAACVAGSAVLAAESAAEQAALFCLARCVLRCNTACITYSIRQLWCQNKHWTNMKSGSNKCMYSEL
jgi:hypothetical protein